ncbi:MAG: hypothetical protein WD398_11790 [Cyclobacteriaceae bacterium]
MKNSQKGMAVLGAVVCMLVIYWNFGVSVTDEDFSDKEMTLENPIAGSGYGYYQAMRRCQGQMTAYNCISDYMA